MILAGDPTDQVRLEWQLLILNRCFSVGDHDVIGAIAEQPFRFADIDWKLTLGDTIGLPSLAHTYNFDLHADVGSASPAQCFSQLSRVITILEGLYGPFGKHPGFAHDDYANDSLYGGLGKFRIRSIGHGSVVRDYGYDNYVTFAEVNEATGEAVQAEGDFFAGTKDPFPSAPSCALRVEAFQSKERIDRARAARKRFGGSTGP